MGHSSVKLSLSAIGWFLIGASPLLLNYPILTIILGIFISIFVQVFVWLPLTIGPEEKRFELPALKRFFPIYAIYLLLLAVYPKAVPLGDWQINTNFQRLLFNEHILLTFRFIEFIAAFTLFGYIIAEMRGRKNESVDRTLCWTFFIAAAAAILIEVLKSCPALNSINILSITIIISASIYGALIYRIQLSSIQR